MSRTGADPTGSLHRPAARLTVRDAGSWSLRAMQKSPASFALILLLGVVVGASAASIQSPLAIVVLVFAYGLQATVAASVVAAARTDGKYVPARVRFREGWRRLRDATVTLTIVVICAIVVLEAILYPLGTVLATVVIVQLGAVLVVYLLLRTAFAIPATVIDGLRPVHAIIDGWLLTRRATSSVLALHGVLVLSVPAAGLMFVAFGTRAAYATGFGVLSLTLGFLVLCLSLTYVEVDDGTPVSDENEISGWQRDGTPV